MDCHGLNQLNTVILMSCMLTCIFFLLALESARSWDGSGMRVAATASRSHLVQHRHEVLSVFTGLLQLNSHATLSLVPLSTVSTRNPPLCSIQRYDSQVRSSGASVSWKSAATTAKERSTWRREQQRFLRINFSLSAKYRTVAMATFVCLCLR